MQSAVGRGLLGLGLVFAVATSAAGEGEDPLEDATATVPARGEESRAQDSPLGLRFAAEVLYGSLDGFAQTPRGGAAASTDTRRPGFGELGIDRAVGGQLELEARWRAWRVQWTARLLRADTRATLELPLVSQGASFPAGTRVRSQLQLDSYRLGLGRRFVLPAPDLLGGKLAWTPRTESVLLDFGHRVEGTLPGQRTHREYQRFGARIGSLVWLGGDRCGLELGGFWGLPIGTLAEISSASAIARCAVELGERARLSLSLGTDYEHIEFEDSQSTPNRIEADYGPTLRTGLELAF